LDLSCSVLEVGPGFGALTRELSKVAGHVVSVELDRRLIPLLEDEFAACSNVEIVQGDILRLDIPKLMEGKLPGGSRHVCANLPYNITTPALSAFLDADMFESITVMIQKEVARRTCAKPGSADYGAFTVYVNYFMTTEILFDVPPACFTPRPKVFSSVVLMKTKGVRLLAVDDEVMFFRVVRAAFGQRRKTLVNSLYAAFGNYMSKDDVAEIVKNCGFDKFTRGETLGLEEFLKLTDAVKSSKKIS